MDHPLRLRSESVPAWLLPLACPWLPLACLLSDPVVAGLLIDHFLCLPVTTDVSSSLLLTWAAACASPAREN